MRYDRLELLGRTDLGTLADELLGGHRGHGRSARWPSPVPDHPQTGATPPMSIFRDRHGVERWTCFATGTAGTAIDLVMVATGRSLVESIAWLAERTQLEAAGDRDAPRPAPRTWATPNAEGPATEPSDALRAYVAACGEILWTQAGEKVRRWLVEGRALSPDVLRANLVGADPGRSLPRARGLPWRGRAAVFPALDADRTPVYLQARYLHAPPNGRKYDNPAAPHGTNPRLTLVHPAAEPTHPQLLVVTEGMPDALTAATAGYRAAAVFGAGLPDARVADRIAAATKVAVLVFDADAPGRAGAARLGAFLSARGTRVLDIRPPAADLNTWAVATPDGFNRELARSIDLAACVSPRHAASRGRR